MTIARKSAVKKAAAKKPAAKKAAPKKAAAKKPAAKRKPNAAFMKAMTPSGDLAPLIGDKPIPRTEVTKKIWNYIKKNKPQDSANKRRILPATLEPQSLTHAQIEMMVKSVRKP
jgi:chromatin remodeling complex protein RSC6